ncbi:MAG: hypothetical protein R3332_02410 [Pseudohongiellaceae bacterium]|nr:hypothetical protein [Pseudohongiellaceae bacterium]
MIKKLLGAALALFIVVGVIVYFYYESAIKSAIEIAGSNALGTQVTVEGVSLSPLSGQGSITGLTVANPEGFEAPYAIELGELALAINVDSLFSDIIEIDSILVEGAHITYETRLVNDNIRTLLANIPTSEGVADPVNENGPASKKVIIRDFQMLAPQITLQTAVAAAPINLPELHLTNIGDESNAVTAAEAIRQVLVALNTSLVSANVRNFDTIKEGVQTQLQDGVDKIGEKANEVTDGLKNLFSR